MRKSIIKRVLVVDDEEDMTWSISKHLSKEKDKYELICVNSGRHALDVLSQLPVDLVISDIRMPEISGLELLTEIKDSFPNTKVIIMTAYGSSEIQAEANERGCLKYIEKPFEINELRQLINTAIQEKKGFEGKISEFHLTDLIQMNCLGRMTTTLYVEHEGSKGAIYFDEGNIIHAEYENIEGEDAFYEILSWEGGNISVSREKVSVKDTIVKGWQSLLLEGMRRLDISKEKKRIQKRNVASVSIYDLLQSEEKADVLRAVFGNLVHNLKSEISSINLSIESIRNSLTDTRRIQDDFDLIKRNIQLSKMFLRRVQGYFDSINPNFSSVSVAMINEAIEKLIYPRLPSSINIETTYDNSLEKFKVKTDLEQLIGVIHELYRNSSKVLKTKNSIIRLEYKILYKKLSISIADNGPGIPKNYIKFIFNKRIPNSNSSGMGLFYSHKIIQMLDGELLLDTEYNNGTKFIILLSLIKS